MNRHTFAVVALTLAAVIFFALNILTNSVLRQARIDLTENKQFTLSAGTISTLQKTEEPVTLRFFYSREAALPYPSIRGYGERVLDMLKALARVSDGKVILEVIEPEPFSADEDRAAAAGLLAVPTSAGDTIYFGLEGINLADGHELIPYFSPEREAFLEYDLTMLIERLRTLERPAIGLLTKLPLVGGPGGAFDALGGQGASNLLYDTLTENFDIVVLEADLDRVPADLAALIVIHPADLPSQALYAIDQFVIGGGRALVFVDPLSELALDVGREQAAGPTDSSDLEPLFEAWGISVPLDKVVGDRLLAQRVMIGQGPAERIIEYVAWLGLTSAEMNPADPVSAEIDQLNLASAGQIRPIEGATTTLTPLMQSSPDAMLIAADELRFMPDPDRLLRGFQATGEVYTLAARVTGPARSAFPDGPPPAPEAVDDETETAPPSAAAPLPPHIAEAAQGINVIVVADTDLFDDRFWVRIQSVLNQRIGVPTADNADFVLNAVENLLGSSDLIALRGRDVAARRFTVVEELRRLADMRYLAEEEALSKKLEQTEARLRALQEAAGSTRTDGDEPAPLFLSGEQQAEITSARLEIAETRAALRAVQHNLKRDIDALGTWLRVINIGVVPIIVAVVALLLVFIRRRARARRAHVLAR